jgi:cytochrome P450
MQPIQALALDEIDLSDSLFWSRPPEEREGAFLTLREQDPIRFFEEPLVSELFPPGPGYYSLTRHADVVEASKNAALFCSGSGTNIPDMPTEFLEFLGSMINMDDPKHARMRRIVSRGFTPRQLDQMKGDVETTATEIVDAIIERGEGDFVTDVAATLPLRINVDMMGIPRSQERFIFDRTNVILGLGDPEYVPDQTEAGIMAALLTATQDLAMLVTELAEDRQKDPKDDLTTALVTAEVDGETLTPSEMASFFILLVAAGNETTRNAIAHGLLALTQHPEQMARWQGDFDGMAVTAVEEIVRWASPVIHFRRTCTQDGARIGSTPSPRATRSSSGTPRRTAMRRSSTTPTGSTSGAPRTTTSASAARVRTSAWAPTWPDARSPSCSGSCSGGCPTSVPTGRPNACSRTSSTGSSTSPPPGPPRRRRDPAAVSCADAQERPRRPRHRRAPPARRRRLQRRRRS